MGQADEIAFLQAAFFKSRAGHEAEQDILHKKKKTGHTVLRADQRDFSNPIGMF